MNAAAAPQNRRISGRRSCATAARSDCREFTTMTIGGQPHQATGEACPEPDGSWRIR
jgi:surface antigen